MKKIAIVGTGIMGNGMAANFLEDGYEVIVWNRHQEKLHKLKELGAIIAQTPKEAAQKAEMIFEVTANDQSSKKVWLGKDGILAGAREGEIVIASSTLSIDWTDQLAKLAAKKNLVFFDMPLTGGRAGAESGRLTLLIGGNKIKLKQIENDLKSISQTIWYFGEAGSGMRFKLVLNSLQAIHTLGFGEAMNMAKNVGLNLDIVGKALSERPGGTATNMAWSDYQHPSDKVSFAVQWITKDLEYAKKMSSELYIPIVEGTLARLKKAMKKKMGEQNWTNVNKADLD